MKKLYMVISGILIIASIVMTRPVSAADHPVETSAQHAKPLPMIRMQNRIADRNLVPQVSISTPSYPIGIKSGETKLVPYGLKETGNASGELTGRSYQYFTQYDIPLSDVMGPFPTRVSIRSSTVTNWNERVYLPQSVVDKARSMDEYAIVLKTTFEGQSSSGAKFNTQASLLLLLPPASFGKNTPANGAVEQPNNSTLQWNSSVGAIDYEYCLDVFNNNSCDTEWTGTYWLGTYDTSTTLQNLPSGTTFYWQVRANNMAGTTYANNGAWWSFTTSCTTNLVTVTNITDSGAGSLRQALADICPGGTIRFAAYLSGQTIALDSTLWIYKDMTIDGSALNSKIRISGNNNVTVFRVLDFNVSLNDLIVTKGNSGSDAGGGIQTGGTLRIVNSIISENTGGFGGGIQNLGTLNITNSTFSNNSAVQGGGMVNAGPLHIVNSTFSGNVADEGGGLLNVSTADLTNSTFSNNSAVQNGGGVINYAGTVSMTNSTFSGNSAPVGAGFFNAGTLNSVNTILANSTSSADCYNVSASGVIGTNINNLIETNAVSPNPCGSPAFAEDPKLAPLANKGGPTQTLALLAGSPAINAGQGPDCPATDQRGVTRPQGENCDIGSYEAMITFADVPPVYWAWDFIEQLYSSGITAGCNTNPIRYCPDTTVTRAQMAVFLERGIHGSSFVPPAVGGSTGFGDVTPAYWAAAWIKHLAVDGITAGCGSSNYCPDSPVTRSQMAVFLLRSKYSLSYVPPSLGGSTGFTDVPANHWAAAWIKQLAAEGITSGCGSGNYCPDVPVTRAQMAVFLVKTFNLP